MNAKQHKIECYLYKLGFRLVASGFKSKYSRKWEFDNQSIGVLVPATLDNRQVRVGKNLNNSKASKALTTFMLNTGKILVNRGIIC